MQKEFPWGSLSIRHSNPLLVREVLTWEPPRFFTKSSVSFRSSTATSICISCESADFFATRWKPNLKFSPGVGNNQICSVESLWGWASTPKTLDQKLTSTSGFSLLNITVVTFALPKVSPLLKMLRMKIYLGPFNTAIASSHRRIRHYFLPRCSWSGIHFWLAH